MTTLLVCALLALSLLVFLAWAWRVERRQRRALEVQVAIDAYADRVCDEMDASRVQAQQVLQADMDRRRALSRTLKEGMAHETIRQRLFEAVQLYELPAEREGGADQ